jgi:WD40 repeat protein
VLELDDGPPEECAVPPLLCPRDPAGHGFVAKGFPEGSRRKYPDGASAEGSISGMTGPGNEWRQLIDHGMLIAPGFSGAPVWDETAEAVTGIVVARDHEWVRKRQLTNNAAFMIPLSVLIDTWEPLTDQVGWRVRFDPERELHWEPRSRGVQRVEDGRQLFSGRERALEELAEWLRDPEGARMVTARPGSGKSAVLARLVMLADPDENAALLREAPTTTVPPNHAIDLAIVAGDLTQRRVIEKIARWTGGDADSPKALLRELAKRERPPVIVVDQLDEAREPTAIVELLRRLGKEGVARVLVGLRSDDEGWLQGQLAPAVAIDLDAEPYFERADLVDYSRRLLLGGKAREADRAAAEGVVGGIAEEVAKRAGMSFLVAWLLATPLAEATTLSPLPGDGYPDQFEIGLAMELYVENAAGQEAKGEEDRKEIEERIRDLLTALAFAEGSGLPFRGEVWPRIATAVSRRSDPEYAAEDVDELRRNAARHLIQAGDSERARLFHRELAAELRRRWGDEEEAQCRMARALAGLCPADEPAPAPPYVEAHLAGHVRRAGGKAWEELSGAPWVLDRLDPLAVSSEARRSGIRLGDLPEAIRGIVNSQRLMAQAGPGDRAGLRQLGMARVCGRIGFAAADVANEISDWCLLSAVLRRYPPHFTTDAGAPVGALVSFVGRDDRPMLVAGCADGSVRLWDALTGQPSGDPPSGDSPVRALAACEVEGTSWLVSGDEEGTVRTWSALDLEVTDFPSKHRQLRAVAAFAGGGELFVATAGEEHEVRLWRKGEPVGVLLDEAPVRALAAIPRGEGTMLMAGGEGDSIRIWDIHPDALSAAKPPSLPADRLLSGFSKWVRALCAFGDEGEEPRIAAAGEDLRLHIWRLPAEDQAAESAALHSASVRALATYGTDAGVRVATAGRDAEIRLWNPDDGKPVGGPFLGHGGTVAALATYEAGGTAGLVSAGDDGSARFWEPVEDEDAEASGTSAPPVTAVAAGDLSGGACAMTGDEEGWIRVWDPKTGKPVYDAFRAHTKAVRVIAPYDEGGRLLIASGGDDGVVRFHDSETGKEVEHALAGHGEPVRALLLGVEVDGAPAAIATGGEDGTVRFWRQDGHEEIPELASRHGENVPVRDLAPLRLGKHGDCLAVVGFSRELLVRGVATTEMVRGPVEAHSHWVMAVEAYPGLGGPRLVTSGADGAVRTHNPQATTPPRLLGRHENPVRALAVIPDGERHLVVSGCENGIIRVWDPEAEEGALRAIHLGTPVNALCELDGRLLIGTAEGHLVLSVRPLSR